MSDKKYEPTAVKCGSHKLTRIDLLKPHPKNPNKHSDRQIDLLAKIIKRTGYRTPIVVSNRSGYIVRGHARLLAAKEENIKSFNVEISEKYCDVILRRYKRLYKDDATFIKNVN